MIILIFDLSFNVKQCYKCCISPFIIGSIVLVYPNLTCGKSGATNIFTAIDAYLSTSKYSYCISFSESYYSVYRFKL